MFPDAVKLGGGDIPLTLPTHQRGLLSSVKNIRPRNKPSPKCVNPPYQTLSLTVCFEINLYAGINIDS